MQKVHQIALTGAALAALAIGSSFAFAHSNGHESRTVSDCEKLPGTAKEGERAGCLACIGRNTEKAKYHFHPDYPAGDRCRLDDGKP
jgi:uncharacterized membrane protein